MTTTCNDFLFENPSNNTLTVMCSYFLCKTLACKVTHTHTVTMIIITIFLGSLVKYTMLFMIILSLLSIM